MGARRLLSVLILAVVIIVGMGGSAKAATYSFTSQFLSPSNWPLSGSIIEGTVYGFNITHGFGQLLNWQKASVYSEGKWVWQIRYDVPDDGSTWNVYGTIIQTRIDSNGQYSTPSNCTNQTFTATHTTGGTFTGASIGTAVAAANSAKTSADSAAANALSAKNSADTAANDTNYIRTSLLSVSGGIVQDAQGTVLSVSRDALTAINNVQTQINDIKTIIAPEITRVQGVGGATCTTSNEYTVVVSTSPKNGVTLSATCTGPTNPVITVNENRITFSGLANGAYTATITANIGENSTETNSVFFKV